MTLPLETFKDVLDRLNQIAKENPETLDRPLLIRDKDLVTSWSYIHDVRITWDHLGYPIYPTDGKDTVQPHCVYFVAFID